MNGAMSMPPPLALPPEVGARAPFFGPSPIGVGTSDVESAANYVLRVAVSHRDSLFYLLRSRPLNLDPSFIDALSAIGTRYDTEILTGGVNGSPQGAVIARAFATLTGRPAVAWTTFSAYNGYAGLRRFLHHQLRWCPQCLAEDSDPYERLIWTARLLSVCPHHQIRLISACPHCGWPGARRIVRGRLFLCRRCMRPLYSSDRDPTVPLPPPTEIAVSQGIAQFCQALFERSIDLKKHNLIAELCGVAEKHGADSANRQADFLGVSKASLSAWLTGQSHLTLVRYIEICLSLGIAPLQPLLDPDVRATISRNGPNKIRSRYWASSKRTKYRPVTARLRARVMEIHEQYPAMGVGAIADRMGYERTNLFHRFPDLCHSITVHARNTRREQQLRKLEAVKTEVGDIIKALVAQGTKPTMRNIAGQMKSPGWFRSHEIRAHRVEVLARLTDLPTSTPPLPLRPIDVVASQNGRTP